MEDVLPHALVAQPTPIVWEEPVADLAKRPGADEGSGVRAH
jgi:ATP-dependent Lon protease